MPTLSSLLDADADANPYAHADFSPDTYAYAYVQAWSRDACSAKLGVVAVVSSRSAPEEMFGLIGRTNGSMICATPALAARRRRGAVSRSGCAGAPEPAARRVLQPHRGRPRRPSQARLFLFLRRMPTTGERTVLPVLAVKREMARGSAPRTAERTHGVDPQKRDGPIHHPLAHRREHREPDGDGLPGRSTRSGIRRRRRQALDAHPDRRVLRRGGLSVGERAGRPFAIALSARSNALQEFEGGPGQIALHGRANLGGVLGTDDRTAAFASTATRCAGSRPDRSRLSGQDQTLSGAGPAVSPATAAITEAQLPAPRFAVLDSA